MWVGRGIVYPATRLCAGPFLELLDRIFDRSDQVEILLRLLVVVAIDGLLEPADRVGDRHVLALEARELLRDEERLRQESLELAGAGHGEPVVFRQLVDAENRDDVLQVLVALQDLLYLAGDIVVL